MFDEPLNNVPITLCQSLHTLSPSSNFSSFGTIVQPSLTPVNPAGFDKELTSIAHSLAPSISKIDLGKLFSLINSEYAASKIIIDLFFLAKSTSSLSCSFVATAPVGLLGEQK